MPQCVTLRNQYRDDDGHLPEWYLSQRFSQAARCKRFSPSPSAVLVREEISDILLVLFQGRDEVRLPLKDGFNQAPSFRDRRNRALYLWIADSCQQGNGVGWRRHYGDISEGRRRTAKAKRRTPNEPTSSMPFNHVLTELRFIDYIFLYEDDAPA